MILTETATLAAYGYPLLYVGTIVEGEFAVLAATALAATGHMDPAGVLVVAVAGALTGDHICYRLGRHGGRRWLNRRPRWQQRTARAMVWLRRWEWAVMLGYRFFYGCRSVIPFAIGMGGVRPIRFAVTSIVSAGAWGLIMLLAGKAVVTAFQQLSGILHPGWIAAGIAALTAVAVIIHRRRRRECDTIDHSD